MVVRVKESKKAKKGPPAGMAITLFLLFLLVGISLVPSMTSTKTLNQKMHSRIFYDIRASGSSSNFSSSSWDQPSSSVNTTANHKVQHAKHNPTTPNPKNHDTSNAKNGATKQTQSNTNILLEPHDNPRKDDSSITIPHFEKQEGVAIVTQIHGPHQYGLLRQSFCLLHKAYNSRMLYDLIVFLADPLSKEQVEEMTKLVHPANLTFVNNAPQGLHGLIEELSPERKQDFLNRCNVNASQIHTLNWFSNCPGRLAYNWQAEFRSLRVWRQPALAKYKYMFWLDSDMFATEVWNTDPIAYMVAHDLVVFFAHYGGGTAKPMEVVKTKEYYGKGFCELTVKEDGFLHSLTGPNCDLRFSAIHGFFHITNLDFYRTDEVHGFLTHFREGCFLCRDYDDQVAVTVPPAMLAPNRSKDMGTSGLILNNYHNGAMDGQRKAQPMGFKNYWRKHLAHNFTEAQGVCEITEGG